MVTKTLNCTAQVLSEIRGGSRIKVARLARLYGSSPQTGIRWALDGCRGLKLESARVGNMLYTSEPAAERFFRALSAGNTSPTPQVDAADRQSKTAAIVEAELTAAGI